MVESKLVRWDPMQGLTRWNESLDQFFNDMFSRQSQPDGSNSGLMAPAIDISEDANSLMVTAELPGLDRKDIELQVKDGVLMLRGEKKHEEETKERNFHRIERRYGSFYRALALPESVDSNKVEANFKNGVLTVRLPKREETKPRSIAIKD